MPRATVTNLICAVVEKCVSDFVCNGVSNATPWARGIVFYAKSLATRDDSGIPNITAWHDIDLQIIAKKKWVEGRA
jgi:hypothetical protein